MNVSVIIPAYNASATLREALLALTQQDIQGSLEVIVVDDGSLDNTREIVQQFATVKYLSQENAGPAAARNLGASVAQGDFLCFTDSDCIPRRDWVRKLLQGFHEPNIAVVCGSYGIANPSKRLSRCIQEEILYRHRYLMTDYPKVFGSYNFCMRTKVFRELKGFNALYRRASGEDNDLSYRLIARGQKIYFERNAIVNHYHTSDLVKYLREQSRHGHWRMMMYADHPQMMKGDSYTFWKDIVEVPWSALCLVGIGISVITNNLFLCATYFTLFFFLFFELCFSFCMIQKKYDAFYFGFVMFLRAFVRSFGLSTGIIYFLFTRFKKKSK